MNHSAYFLLHLAIFIVVLFIGWKVAQIEEGMKDFRPVRTYYFNDNRQFDVSRVDKLEICERFADAARGE